MRGRWSTRAPAVPVRAPLFWTGALVVTYALQLVLAALAAKHGPWPIPVVAWSEGATPLVLGEILCGALQAYALFALARGGAPRFAVAAAAAAMLAFSLCAPVLFNADVYAYVADGALQRAAYAPPTVPLPGDLAAVNAWWGTPLPAATYGPLWLALAHLIAAPAAGLLAKTIAFRVAGALAGVLVLALLRAYGLPERVLLLVALNPALYAQFVLDAHNDMLPLAIVLAAALAARRQPALAAALIAGAALIKLPYVLAGLPVLLRARPPAVRAVAAAFAVASAIFVSAITGGRPYLHALLGYANAAPSSNPAHVLAALAGVAAIAGALVCVRRLRTAVWLIPSFGAYAAPWYALWSVPYALASRRATVYLLCAFPLVSALAEPALVRWWTLAIAVPALTVASLAFYRRQSGPSYR